MLQGVQPEVSQARRFLVTENAEDTALFSEFIEHNDNKLYGDNDRPEVQYKQSGL